MTVLRPILAGALTLAVSFAMSAPAEASRKSVAHPGVLLAKAAAKPPALHGHRAHVMDTVARRMTPPGRHPGLVMTRNTPSTTRHSPGPA